MPELLEISEFEPVSFLDAAELFFQQCYLGPRAPAFEPASFLRAIELWSLPSFLGAKDVSPKAFGLGLSLTDVALCSLHLQYCCFWTSPAFALAFSISTFTDFTCKAASL